MIDERQLAVDELQRWIDEHPVQFSQRIEQAERDIRFSLSHMPAWRRQYPNSWMAVSNATLVAIEETQETLLETLHRRGVSALDAHVFFVHDEETSLIL